MCQQVLVVISPAVRLVVYVLIATNAPKMELLEATDFISVGNYSQCWQLLTVLKRVQIVNQLLVLMVCLSCTMFVTILLWFYRAMSNSGFPCYISWRHLIESIEGLC